ncbi:MAG: ribbon-helix-helix domain-containing protein [candidate division Zixibacteria bacterium]|nr:ribbon-helix-helix domain-containing protein [candidate division Zixibacteria bacterium]
MSRKKISTTVYITLEQDEKLKLLNRKTKVPVMVLERHRQHLPGQLSFEQKGTGR